MATKRMATKAYAKRMVTKVYTTRSRMYRGGEFAAGIREASQDLVRTPSVTLCSRHFGGCTKRLGIVVTTCEYSLRC
jgi:hypothetical protein